MAVSATLKNQKFEKSKKWPYNSNGSTDLRILI